MPSFDHRGTAGTSGKDFSLLPLATLNLKSIPNFFSFCFFFHPSLGSTLLPPKSSSVPRPRLFRLRFFRSTGDQLAVKAGCERTTVAGGYWYSRRRPGIVFVGTGASSEFVSFHFMLQMGD
jgi:hypothetical protein